MINVGILTVNDAVFNDLAMDTSGPAVRSCLPPDVYSIKEMQVVGEDAGLISAVVEKWCKPDSDIQLVITTGGTGLSAGDVTPDAVSKLIQIPIPGIPEAIRATLRETSPRAMLSRQVAGMRGKTIIVTIQGNPNQARQSMQIILPALGHAFTLITPDKMPNRRVA